MAKAQFITTKYGTKINVTGLTPEQVTKVRTTAEANGAYGAKGAALASTFQKKNAAASAASAQPAAPAAPAAPAPEQATTGPELGVNGKTGGIDPNRAVPEVTQAAIDDTTTNFNQNNPGSQTDSQGNSQTITRDANGNVVINKTAGAGLTAANNAFTSALTDFTANGQSGRQNAENAAYNYISQNYAKQKQQEQESAKQELANRGIPVDPNPNSLYGRTLAQIDQKYQSLDDQAKNQGLTAGNAYYSTNVGAIGSLGSTIQGQQQQTTQFQGATSNQAPTLENLLATMSDADLKKYGIDKTDATNRLAIMKRGSGGGGGGSDSHSPIIAGQNPGVNG